jgi:hypothetical protein
MNSLFLSKEFKRLRWFFVEDRNSTTSDMQRWFSDLTNIVRDDNLAILVANRNTSYMYNPVGAASFLVEQGFVSVGPQKVSTGWGTMQKLTYNDSLNMHSYEDAPVMPLTGATSDFQKGTGLSFWERLYNYLFGLIGFTPNAPGQSEDYQAILGPSTPLVKPYGLRSVKQIIWGHGHRRQCAGQPDACKALMII